MQDIIETNKIDGLGYAKEMHSKMKVLIDKLQNKFGIIPNIAIILIGNDPASEIYVRNKKLLAEKLGISAEIKLFKNDITEQELIKEINDLNNDDRIDGMIVQMPIPEHINLQNVLLSISPKKDLDGLNQFNAGLLHSSKEVPYTIEEVLNEDVLDNKNLLYKISNLGEKIPFIPCTPLGCLHLIDNTFKKCGEKICGKNAVIFGNSNLVSKPMARLLLQTGATTTTLHSKSRNIDYIIENADIIVSATGKFQQINNIKQDAILIDVGIRPKDNSAKGITGDLDYNTIVKTNRISPVPFGVGPMTVATLMMNACLSSMIKLKQ